MDQAVDQAVDRAVDQLWIGCGSGCELAVDQLWIGLGIGLWRWIIGVVGAALPLW